MASTFLGLQIARSAVNASQIALNTTGQNISNSNTVGYTRQRVDLVALNFNGTSNLYTPAPANNAGQGVNVLSISQTRDAYLDARVRNANSEYSTSDTLTSALKEVESILDENATDGLHDLLGKFYKELQSLSNNSDESVNANIVRSTAEKVTQAMKQYASLLQNVREGQSEDIGIEVSEVNTIVKKLNEVNDAIKAQTLRNSVSNELLDTRNNYLDELSGYMNIHVVQNADGTVSVHPSASDATDLLAATYQVTFDADGNAQMQASMDGGATWADYNPTQGSIKGHLEAINGAGGFATGIQTDTKGIPYYQKSLDALANAFAGTFNTLNTVDGSGNPITGGVPLFSGTTAASITISSAWRANENAIVRGVTGSNDNVMRMVTAMDEGIDPSYGISGTFEGYTTKVMSDIAVDVGYYDDIRTMKGGILDAVSTQRESITGVSINEETINMTTYQRSYQAAARLMNVFDDMLDTIINGMGRVGRG